MKYNPQDNVKAQYRNTRSKFYTKPQKSFEGDDNKPETATQGTGGQWKEKGNEYFKAKNYDKAIECYSKAIVFVPARRKSILEKANTTQIDPSATRNRATSPSPSKTQRSPASSMRPT